MLGCARAENTANRFRRRYMICVEGKNRGRNMTHNKDEPLVYNSFEELLGILAEERRKSLKSRKNVKIILAVYTLFFCLLVLVAVVSHHNLSGFSGMGGFVTVIAGMYAVSEKQRKGVQALAAFEDVRAVPYLIAGLGYKDQKSQVTAANALRGLLPRLQASDAALLTPEHHALLNRALKSDLELEKPGPARLRVAVLQALQQIGGVSSLPLVAEMAEGRGKAAGQPEVQSAAQECLPFLQLRAENQRLNHTLLRASDGNVTPVEMLLRPASGQFEATLRAAELLRVPQEDTKRQATARPTFAVHEPQQAEQELHR